MYHDVLPTTEAAGGGPERFSVPLPSFEVMLDAIAESSLQGCSLDKGVNPSARQRVAITFDDGTAGQFDHAFPALRVRAMTATFFVTTDWIGEPGFMTWDQLRELVSCGMAVESHTKSHPFLSELTASELVAELVGSKAELDARLNQQTTQLSLPGGDAPRRVHRHLIREAGYQVVAGSHWGLNPVISPHTATGRLIRRCTVRGRVDAAGARKILAGDPRLALARYPREVALNGIRTLLGPSRYARIRRQLLDRVQRGSAPF
jgi:peptidoglycan/xylan/chitin deacetylase (PgdA/CDA1 family)